MLQTLRLNTILKSMNSDEIKYYNSLKVVGWKIDLQIGKYIVSTYLDPFFKYKVKKPNKPFKKMKACKIQAGDIILGKKEYQVIDIESPIRKMGFLQGLIRPRRPKFLKITDTVREFIEKLNVSEYNEYSSDNIQNLIKEYNIDTITFRFLGLYIENMFGDGTYISGATFIGNEEDTVSTSNKIDETHLTDWIKGYGY